MPGCGGGDGGPGNDTSQAEQPVPAFGLDAGTASLASKVAFVAMDHAGAAAEQAVIAAELTTLQDPDAMLERAKELRDLPDLNGYRCPPLQYAGTHGVDDLDANQTLDEGETLILEVVGCGVRQYLSLRVSEIGETSDGTFSVAGDVVLTMTYDTGLHVTGEFVLKSSSAMSVAIDDTELALHEEGRIDKILDANLTRSVSDDATYTIRLAGRGESTALGGEFRFRTVSDLTGVADDFPASGEVRLTAGETTVRVRAGGDPAMADHAQVDVDEGNGVYESADPIVWRTLIRALFGAPNSRPTIDRLAITPEEPKTDDVLSVSYWASDPDRDPVTLEFEWYRNGILVKRNADGYLDTQLTAKHDRIEVTMTMSDARWGASETADTVIENSTPVIAGLAIAPDSPTTIDDLVAGFELIDEDGDELAESYQWTVNGVASEHVGLRLPADSHRKGDEVTFRIDVDDGEASTETETTAQIVDAPPRITVAAPPQQVMFGERAEFSASVDDPDGEPVDQLRYRLAYGPLGMAVDAESGAIDWTPALPMFDRQMDIAWAVEVDHPDSAPASGVISLHDPDRQYPFMRGGRVGFEARFRMGDFDADGTVEILRGVGDAAFVWTGRGLRAGMGISIRRGST